MPQFSCPSSAVRNNKQIVRPHLDFCASIKCNNSTEYASIFVPILYCTNVNKCSTNNLAFCAQICINSCCSCRKNTIHNTKFLKICVIECCLDLCASSLLYGTKINVLYGALGIVLETCLGNCALSLQSSLFSLLPRLMLLLLLSSLFLKLP